MSVLLQKRSFTSSRSPMFDRSTVWLGGIYIALWTIVSYLLLGGNFRALILLATGAAIFIGWSMRPIFGIAALFAYLLLLGDIRRVIDMVMGQRPGLDPLLLVGFISAALFALPILMRLRVKIAMAKMVLALTAMMILGIFNPSQGSLLVGFTGSLFYVVPILWFWIGRTHINEDSLTALFSFVIFPLGLVAAFLGIWQTLFGFLTWEQQWIDNVASMYSALYIGAKQIRPFGYSVSSAEFGDLLVITFVYATSTIFTKRRVFALLIPIIALALLFASMRGAILHCLLAAVGMWAVATRRSAAIAQRLMLFAGCCIVGIIILTQFGNNEEPQIRRVSTSTAVSATNHVTSGLAHPLDSRYSTAGIHFQLLSTAIIAGFTHPIGYGIGVTTAAGGKFGSGWTSSEADFSDIFVAIGAGGGILYVSFIVYTMVKTFQIVRANYTGIALTVWGIEIAMLGQWIANGQYSIGPIVWICLGYICRTLEHDEELAANQSTTAAGTLASPSALALPQQAW